MFRVSAMLSWFDEPVELLRECVAGIAVFADRLVCADGAFALAPGARPQSPPSQKRVIREAAREAGIERVEFLRPRIWEGQVTKRDALLQAAKQHSRWVMVVDADWLVSGDAEAIATQLDALYQSGCEQVLLEFVTPENPDRPLAESAANIWHVNQAGTYLLMPLIYRSLPQMHYHANHWSIVGWTESKRPVGFFGGGDGYLLPDGGGVYQQARTAALRVEHLIEHRCLFRERKQIERSRDYIIERDREVERVGYET